MDEALTATRQRYQWWRSDPALVALLEHHAAREPDDRVIVRLPLALRRQHPGLRRLIEARNPMWWDVWGYMAWADGPWGLRRLVAVLPDHPAKVDPVVLCLDGPTESLHRNGGAGSLWLCLYSAYDHSERRWKLSDGLPRLFDLGRRHVWCEHQWRKTGIWPIPDAPHGAHRPAPRAPGLELPAELDVDRRGRPRHLAA